MNPNVHLSDREEQITELIAWGAAAKEIADLLSIHYKTADNHIQSIKKKIGCNKVTEISAWWFCTKYGISFELSPFRRPVLMA